MKTKKGQLSIFLIVGFVAVMIVAFLLIMKEDNFAPFKKTSTTPLDTHIKLCEEQAAECLLYRLGATSGKLIFTPGVLPGFGEMEGNARRYTKNTPQECFAFDKFPGQEITINGLTPNLQLNHQNLRVEFVNDIITQNSFDFLDTISDLFFDLIGGALAVLYFFKKNYVTIKGRSLGKLS